MARMARLARTAEPVHRHERGHRQVVVDGETTAAAGPLIALHARAALPAGNHRAGIGVAADRAVNGPAERGYGVRARDAVAAAAIDRNRRVLLRAQLVVAAEVLDAAFQTLA